MEETAGDVKKRNAGDRTLHERWRWTSSRIRTFIFTLFATLVTAFVLPTRAATWTTNSPMLVPRYDHTATRLQNGKMLVTGGQTNICGATTAPTVLAEIFNPSTSPWSLSGVMTTPRSGHTATLLPDGTVLVAGGTGNVAPTLFSSAELYHPGAQRQGGFWRAIAPMNFGRTLYTATLLTSGKVLVTGGYQGDCVVLASTEMYHSTSQATPPTLTPPVRLPNGNFRIGFTNRIGAQFNVLGTSEPDQPLSLWTILGGTIEILPGKFQFTDESSPLFSSRCYRLVSVP